MNSKDYWAKRETEALKHYITDEAEYERQIKRIYQDMLDSCQTQINDFYGRYAAKEGITLAEAKKRVSQLDIEKYERKAAKYVKDKDFSDKANEEMRLYNATMKINRLEMLKANIGLELISGHDELEKFMAGILKGRTEEELKRQAGILGKTIRNNAKTANAIVNGSFKVSKVGEKSTFSDYIWQYQDLMREDLGKLLSTGLIQGKNPRAIAKDLRKYWYGADPKTGGGATYCMERLMRTELARVQTEAQKQSFQANGFDKYIFIVNAGCCGHCEEVADKDSGYGKGVYLVKDMQPGLNAPPIHPNDRCSTAAYEDSDEYEAWLDYLSKGGTTAEWEKAKQKFDLKTLGDVGEKAVSYSERGIEIEPRLKGYLDKLHKNGDYISAKAGTFKGQDLAILTTETGVEYTTLTIGEESYLIRGMEKGTTIPEELKIAIIKNKGTLDYHSHPFIGDLVPSNEDKDFLKLLTWQNESVIIDPEQSAVYFTVYGTKEKFKLNTDRTDDYWLELFGEGD